MLLKEQLVGHMAQVITGSTPLLMGLQVQKERSADTELGQKATKFDCQEDATLLERVPA